MESTSVTIRLKSSPKPRCQSDRNGQDQHKRLVLIYPLVALAAAAAITLTACRNIQSRVAGDNTQIAAYGSFGYRLFQANCASCHGDAGRGDGIAAMSLEIRPRDFKTEPFRYISSDDGVATDADLVQTIRLGRVNGEMPAGPWFTDEEALELAHYIRELNRLGWVERLEQEFQGDDALDPEEVEEISWDRVTAMEPYAVPRTSIGFLADSSIGRTLYLETCASCHGPGGRGDGPEKLFDDLGNPIQARNLTQDLIRGGNSPDELFKRIRSGIPGTPMPGQPGFSNDEIWQLVYYTRTLMGQPLTRTWQGGFEQSIIDEGDE
jgi:mono/diheme cytochrome c family protein